MFGEHDFRREKYSKIFGKPSERMADEQFVKPISEESAPPPRAGVFGVSRDKRNMGQQTAGPKYLEFESLRAAANKYLFDKNTGSRYNNGPDYRLLARSESFPG